MIRAVFFDVGGTLHVSYNSPALADQFSALLLDKLREAGIILPLSASELTPVLHRNAEAYKHWSETTRRELPNLSIWMEYYLKGFQIAPEKIAPIAEKLSVLYDSVRMRNEVRAGMLETIVRLHQMGLAQGIISNIISSTWVPELVKTYGIAPYMAAVVLSEDVGIRKPDPEIFRIASRQVGIPLTEMAYVGDTLSRDVLGARNASLPLVIQIQNPLTAFRDQDYLHTNIHPDYLISELSEIPDIITKKNREAS